MPDPIDTTTLPGDDVFPQDIVTAAADIRIVGSQVSSQAATVVSSWQKLAPDYEAPESGALLQAMHPVKTEGAVFGSNLDKVATALEVFAEEARAIKKTVADIRTDANAFTASIKGGVDKVTVTPQGNQSHTTVPWDEDKASVDKNNELLAAVGDQQELLWAAERKCANALYDLTGHAHVEAASDANPNGYGVDDIPSFADVPWGQQVKQTEHCGEQAATAVSHYFGKGMFMGSVVGGFQAVGGLLGAQWDREGFSWHLSTAVASWQGVAMLANATNPSTLVRALGGDKYSQDSYKALWAAAKGTVAADKWADDPAAAAGEATGNLLLLFVGVGEASIAAKGAGAAGKAGLEASRAAAAVRVGSKVAEFTDPIALALKAAKFAGKGASLSMDALSGLFKNLDFVQAADVGISPKKLDIYLASVEHNSTSVDPPNKHFSHSEAAPVHDQPQARERTNTEPRTVSGAEEPSVATSDTERSSSTVLEHGGDASRSSHEGSGNLHEHGQNSVTGGHGSPEHAPVVSDDASESAPAPGESATPDHAESGGDTSDLSNYGTASTGHKLEGSTNGLSWETPEGRQAWVDAAFSDPANTRPLTGSRPSDHYQRVVVGEFEVRLTADDPPTRIWADGVSLDPDKVVALDTKLVENPARSMYEGTRPQPMQEVLMRQFDDEMFRYRNIIESNSTPVQRLRIIASTPRAAEYLGDRARRLLGSDIDLDVVVVPEGS